MHETVQSCQQTRIMLNPEMLTSFLNKATIIFAFTSFFLPFKHDPGITTFLNCSSICLSLHVDHFFIIDIFKSECAYALSTKGTVHHKSFITP